MLSRGGRSRRMRKVRVYIYCHRIFQWRAGYVERAGTLPPDPRLVSLRRLYRGACG